MARSFTVVGAAVMVCFVVGWCAQAFVAPAGTHARLANAPVVPPEKSRSENAGVSSGGWCSAPLCLIVGAHVGLAAACYGRTALRAAKEAAPAKYVESQVDKRLFQQVYHEYTKEYLKGPMYWHEDKLQGFLPDYPGTPMFKNGKMTSEPLGNLKTFSSNELAFFSVLFFAVGLYGNLMFDVYDPQFPKADAGEIMNASYIVESLFLPISFFAHIAAYIQKKNGR